MNKIKQINLIDDIITNSIKTNKINLKNVDKQYLNNKYNIVHRGYDIKSDDISKLSINLQENPNNIDGLTYCKLQFLYVKVPVINKSYLYYYCDLINLNDLIDIIGYNKLTKNKIVGVNFEQKKYCIELTTNDENNLYINYMTTIPNGCNNTLCNKGLSFLFKVLYIFLNHIEYKGQISLRDDSRLINMKETNLIILRLSQGKSQISIYEKYGFKISSDIYNTILNAFNNKNITELKKHIYNIQMKADNIDLFIGNHKCVNNTL